LKSRVIDITGELDELNELFCDYWRGIMPRAHWTSIAFPFSRLHNEPFWKLVTTSSQPPTAAEINAVTNVTQLRRLAFGAELDAGLHSHLTLPSDRAVLAETLLQSSFSTAAQAPLREIQSLHSEAFEYSQALEEIAHQRKDAHDMIAAATYRPAARDQGFRRAIIVNYDHRCALCGVRIVTPEGQTAVDAAHIVPWSVSRNDDVRNGMALCKLCHWAFDLGMMSVSDSFTVLLSRNISLATNAAGLPGVLERRNFVGPRNSELWPLPRGLA
jgi:putative restriction endonuclease